MTTEEIQLNEALIRGGYDVVESDLGEYIVQLRKEAPYHFVFPSMHLRTAEVSDLFHDQLGAEPTTSPEELTMVARRVMRERFIRADIGITGANFGVAETGLISITENEGNARLTSSCPRVHIAVMGIEKVIPAMKDLALLLPMLGTAGAGQLLTCYNSLIGGPKTSDEGDGPEEFHMVLLDNRRTALLADPDQRYALACIRCGACLNVCPIFNNIGGHTYGTVYQGPIGSVISPLFNGIKSWGHLAHASTLCGACSETCPVKIPIHHMLLRTRIQQATHHPKRLERRAYRIFGWIVSNPRAYRMATRAARTVWPLLRALEGTRLDPLKSWRTFRTLPDMPGKSFREMDRS
jgi:L-lactate dehydrogenase complex protein LldF